MKNNAMKPTRRHWLATAAASALTLTAGVAWAAPPVVEVIAYAHPPVQSALKPLRDWLALQGNKLRVVEIDMESPAAEARLKAVGLKGHIPMSSSWTGATSTPGPTAVRSNSSAFRPGLAHRPA